MTWNGVRSTVTPLTTAYERGATLTMEAMATLEPCLTRHPTLGKWFVDIHPPSPRDSQIPREARSDRLASLEPCSQRTVPAGYNHQHPREL